MRSGFGERDWCSAHAGQRAGHLRDGLGTLSAPVTEFKRRLCSRHSLSRGRLFHVPLSEMAISAVAPPRSERRARRRKGCMYSPSIIPDARMQELAPIHGRSPSSRRSRNRVRIHNVQSWVSQAALSVDIKGSSLSAGTSPLVRPRDAQELFRLPL